VPATTRGSKLALQQGDTPARNKLSWRWRSGVGAGLGGFADPTIGGGFTLCVFERSVASGVARLVASVPGGALCGDRPCWSASSRGYRYRDAAGTSDGIQRMTMAGSSAGRVTIVVRGAGAAVDLPSLAFAFPLTTRVVRDGAAACWDATATQAVRAGGGRLVAVSD
jgi:hypothetical protein